MLPSMDENAKDVDAWKSKLSVKNKVETFSTQNHGWMAARYVLNLKKVLEFLIVLFFFFSKEKEKKKIPITVIAIVIDIITN